MPLSLQHASTLLQTWSLFIHLFSPRLQSGQLSLTFKKCGRNPIFWEWEQPNPWELHNTQHEMDHWISLMSPLDVSFSLLDSSSQKLNLKKTNNNRNVNIEELLLASWISSFLFVWSMWAAQTAENNKSAINKSRIASVQALLNKRCAF